MNFQTKHSLDTLRNQNVVRPVNLTSFVTLNEPLCEALILTEALRAEAIARKLGSNLDELHSMCELVKNDDFVITSSLRTKEQQERINPWILYIRSAHYHGSAIDIQPDNMRNLSTRAKYDI